LGLAPFVAEATPSIQSTAKEGVAPYGEPEHSSAISGPEPGANHYRVGPTRA